MVGGQRFEGIVWKNAFAKIGDEFIELGAVAIGVGEEQAAILGERFKLLTVGIAQLGWLVAGDVDDGRIHPVGPIRAGLMTCHSRGVPIRDWRSL